jgi:hypothetical protein
LITKREKRVNTQLRPCLFYAMLPRPERPFQAHCGLPFAGGTALRGPASGSRAVIWAVIC